MRKVLLLLQLTGFFLFTQAQSKKPLDHTVYDTWQNISEKVISNDGNWIAYVVSVQEGDGLLYIRDSKGHYQKAIGRGYTLSITDDSRFLLFKIKPPFSEIRAAKIKKKKPADFPKDSLGIIELGSDSIYKIPRVKSYQIPSGNAKWITWQEEPPVKDSSSKTISDSSKLPIDSLRKAATPTSPELEKKRKKITTPPVIKNDWAVQPADAEDETGKGNGENPGTPLVLYNLHTKSFQTLQQVKAYHWSKYGDLLLVEAAPPAKDKQPKSISIFRTAEERFDTIMKGGNDFKNYAVSDDGNKIAFVAERDSAAKSLRKFYKLWYWQNGQDTALMMADKNTAGMPIGWTVSDNAPLYFSKSGKRLFFGTAPLPPLKDTSLVEIDLVKVDVWNYKDDYLQTMQLRTLDRELKRSYTALFHTGDHHIVQLADKALPDIATNADADGELIIGQTDVDKRISMQWEGKTKKDIYIINPETGERRRIKENLSGRVQVSAGGNFVIWYDSKVQQYFTWRNGIEKNISAKIPRKLYIEDFDMPDDPVNYGIMGWSNGDLSVFLYDRYDVWQADPMNVVLPVNITRNEGRKNKTSYRYLRTDEEEFSLAPSQTLLFKTFNEQNKQSGLATLPLVSEGKPQQLMKGDYLIGNGFMKAKSSDNYLYSKESYTQSPDLYVNQNWQKEIKLSALNPQQQQYNWGTATLFRWTAYDGKPATGIVYKPENFDPKKKYPTICYFYEKLSDGLHTYIAPAPTPSKLNISFFVSRGYIVLAPDIVYRKGHPGRSAYDYIVSGARALVKKGWADSSKLGLQGQSWGGYQTAYLITQTKLFSAAWAGAPVSNMTSAYGGIRWESGMSRQFQYEKTQSRIGATLWDKPELYIENSPLFHLKKVHTPLVIMHNDNDGAVPWYQGIELFTAMRRLSKPVWMLNYNGEAHNLVERKNRKDIQVREQQFFDWLLKGEHPAQWLRDGVPATSKGINWGLED